MPNLDGDPIDGTLASSTNPEFTRFFDGLFAPAAPDSCAHCGNRDGDPEGELCERCAGIRGLPVDDSFERQSLRVQWSIPDSAPFTFTFLDGEALHADLTGFTAELMSVPADVLGGPYRWVVEDIAGPETPHAIIRARYWIPGTAGFIKTWLDRRFGVRQALQDWDESNGKAAFRLLSVGVDPSKRGRPKGSGRFRDAQEFQSAVQEAAQALRNEGTRVNQETVGRFLLPVNSASSSDRQLRTWLTCIHLNWDDLVRAEN
jgi:hypothetical protein